MMSGLSVRKERETPWDIRKRLESTEYERSETKRRGARKLVDDDDDDDDCLRRRFRLFTARRTTPNASKMRTLTYAKQKGTALFSDFCFCHCSVTRLVT